MAPPPFFPDFMVFVLPLFEKQPLLVYFYYWVVSAKMVNMRSFVMSTCSCPPETSRFQPSGCRM